MLICLTKHLLILLALLLLGTKANSQSPILFNQLADDELVGGYMYIYEDVNANKSIKEIIAHNNLFVPNINNVPHYESTQSAIWLKADIRVETDEPVYLLFNYPIIDSIELFAVGQKGAIIQHKTSGSMLPAAGKDLHDNYIKFKLQKGLYTYYIRAKTTYTLQLPIKIKSFETIYNEHTSENLWLGIYIGASLLIVLFLSFLWLLSRDKVYIYFMLHTISLAIINIYLKGFANVLFWGDITIINLYQPSVFALSLFAPAFAIVFLETSTKHQKIHRLLVASILATVLVFPIDIMGFHQTAHQLVKALIFIGSILMIVAGFAAYKKGFKPARLFIAGRVIFLVFLILNILQRLDILSYEFSLNYDLQIGSLINLILLSFALADRLRIYCGEKESAKEETYAKIKESEEQVRQQNTLLSLKVEERSREMIKQTKILEEQKSQLEELNQTKDKIFSVIAHDLRGPLGNVSQLADMMSIDKNLRNEETIGLLKDASKRSFDLLDSLLHWAKAQFGDSEYQRSKLNLKELAENTLKLYHLKATAKEIKVTNNVPNNLYANADKNMIDTVIRNLLSNALKFTIVGGTIELGGRKNEGQGTVSFWVKDSGMGISKEKLETIFEAGKNKSVIGTDGEVGSGLGLVICKDFVEKNEGTISATSDHGRGSTFTITLPMFNA